MLWKAGGRKLCTRGARFGWRCLVLVNSAGISVPVWKTEKDNTHFLTIDFIGWWFHDCELFFPLAKTLTLDLASGTYFWEICRSGLYTVLSSLTFLLGSGCEQLFTLNVASEWRSPRSQTSNFFQRSAEEVLPWHLQASTPLPNHSESSSLPLAWDDGTLMDDTYCMLALIRSLSLSARTDKENRKGPVYMVLVPDSNVCSPPS